MQLSAKNCIVYTQTYISETVNIDNISAKCLKQPRDKQQSKSQKVEVRL